MTYALPQKYQKMTEAEVTQALADKHDSQIVQELACLTNLYSRLVARVLRRGGSIEETLSLPSCALEKLALQIVIDAGKSDVAGKA